MFSQKLYTYIQKDVEQLIQPPTACTLCPRRCGTNRARHAGRCGGGSRPRLALAAPHHWEEPCISGSRGSGAVFFGGCGLGCAFCQNHAISHKARGRPVAVPELAGCFLALHAQGVHNLNLVTATHYLPWVEAALGLAREQGLPAGGTLPIVWNTGGYETMETMERLARLVDVWLFDLKFFSPALSARLAAAPDYFEHASAALAAACRMAGPPVFSAGGLLQRGVVVRLLVLPGQRADAMALLAWMAKALPKDGFLLSLMRQYTPPAGVELPPPLGRRLAAYEYRTVAQRALALGLDRGYFQSAEAATGAWLPPFEI